MNNASTITLEKKYSLGSLLYGADKVQSLLLVGALCGVDLFLYFLTGIRYTEFSHGIYIAHIVLAKKKGMGLSYHAGGIAMVLAIVNLIIASTIHGTIRHEVYLLILISIGTECITHHIVTTDFAQRVIILLLFIATVIINGMLQDTLSLQIAVIRCISTLTILLPAIP